MVNSLLWRVFGGPCKEEPTDAHPSPVAVPPSHSETADPIVVGVPQSGHNNLECLPLTLTIPLATYPTHHVFDTAVVPPLPQPTPTTSLTSLEGSSNSLTSYPSAPATPLTPATPATSLTPVSPAGSVADPLSPLSLPPAAPCSPPAPCAHSRHPLPPPPPLFAGPRAPPRSAVCPAPCGPPPRSQALAAGLMDAPASSHVCAEVYNATTSQSSTTTVTTTTTTTAGGVSGCSNDSGNTDAPPNSATADQNNHRHQNHRHQNNAEAGTGGGVGRVGNTTADNKATGNVDSGSGGYVLVKVPSLF
ncbi:hypothetical protein BIW11_05929 [Tropilaelaps mercedesae]|uniref:Uncharacterized protein n=1 Tax=Tropilaelaps mercedesae TaxID=418985 RepID=A0A1V9Y0D5_9ACAR|nr:hypothetical protein BIW11_05929 [Tropilaelaps mercedesae]